MFGFGQREAKTRAKLFREEMGETLDHLQRAAGYAASGLGATVGPRMNAAREYMAPAAGRVRNSAAQSWDSTLAAFTPLTETARGTTRQVKANGRKAGNKLMVRGRKSQVARRRWPRLAGLVAAGAAVGAVGALVMRRRRQQWDEYDPNRALEATGDEARSMIDEAVESATSATSSATEAASRAAEKTRESAKHAAGAGSKKASATYQEGRQQAGEKYEEGKEAAEDMISRSGSPSRNSRN